MSCTTSTLLVRRMFLCEITAVALCFCYGTASAVPVDGTTKKILVTLNSTDVVARGQQVRMGHFSQSPPNWVSAAAA